MTAQTKDEVFHFDSQHIVVAYVYDEGAQKELVGGVFITYPQESFTKKDLLDYFFQINPSYLVAVKVPNVEGLTMENYQIKLEDILTRLYDNKLDELDINYYIPATVH